ncbi:MAG TPA: ABC transporter permease [Ohtaekwangia sp.]|nr:ABC transporter permease [Ohtaekwangia sp.]
MNLRFLSSALRNIRRDGIYSLIKIGGLALGLGTSLILLLYVKYQFSFDKQHPDVERMYRINMTHIWRPGGGIFHSTGPAVAFALREEFPEIEEIVRINTPGALTIRHTTDAGETRAFNEQFDNVFAADSNFFSFFNFPLREGNPKTALVGANKVVLSPDAATKFFGNEPALGKQLQIGEDGQVTDVDANGRILVEVTGVTEEQRGNMHFNFDYLLSMETNPAVKQFEWSWIWTQVVTYVKLRPGTDIAAMEAKLKNFGDRHAPATFKMLGMDYEEFLREKGSWSLYLQPVSDIHLYSGSPSDPMAIGNRLGRTGDIRYVIILGSVGVFILLIAVVNFINLSTARAANRSKEVGVKKALGVTRASLIYQFQLEHIFITFIAMALGLGVMEILRLALIPLGIEVPMAQFSFFWFAVITLTFALVTGFLAGLYPSFYLTAFRPAEVLKGKVASGFKSSRIRNSLVVFQFAISIALMAGTLIVFEQINYFMNADLGFEKENLLVIDRASRLGEQLESFRNEIRKYPGVIDAAVSSDFRYGAEDIFSMEGDDRKFTLAQYKIDEHFLQTTHVPLVSGRGFDEENPADEFHLVINEAAAKVLGWTPEEAIGRKIVYGDPGVGARPVVGVVRDAHFQGMRENVEPVVFYHLKARVWGYQRLLLVRYRAEELPGLLARIEGRWNELAHATPLEYSFYEDDLIRMHSREQKMGDLFTIFTAISVVIAVVGLVGLVAYSAEQRKKEIGVRKVFGASFLRIFVMMNMQYFKLMAIALLIATPLTWYLMHEWLQNYAHRINITPGAFVITGIVEIALAFLCVGFIALRAASLNPAKVLKDE